MFVATPAKKTRISGMIIGENAKPDDLDVNPMKAKPAHQHPLCCRQGRGHPPDPAAPPRPTLEQAIAYIGDDELVEVTPRKSIRLRKLVLNPTFRKEAHARTP